MGLVIVVASTDGASVDDAAVATLRSTVLSALNVSAADILFETTAVNGGTITQTMAPLTLAGALAEGAASTNLAGFVTLLNRHIAGAVNVTVQSVTVASSAPPAASSGSPTRAFVIVGAVSGACVAALSVFFAVRHRGVKAVAGGKTGPLGMYGRPKLKL